MGDMTRGIVISCIGPWNGARSLVKGDQIMCGLNTKNVSILGDKL